VGEATFPTVEVDDPRRFGVFGQSVLEEENPHAVINPHPQGVPRGGHRTSKGQSFASFEIRTEEGLGTLSRPKLAESQSVGGYEEDKKEDG
jgi:hypothetical protein